MTTRQTAGHLDFWKDNVATFSSDTVQTTRLSKLSCGTISSTLSSHSTICPDKNLRLPGNAVQTLVCEKRARLLSIILTKDTEDVLMMY